MATIKYINPNAPQAELPPYRGAHYEALVPATLDLADRARLAVNGLTEPLDPDYDHELYWMVDLMAEQPVMFHTHDDHVQEKFIQALPLVRTASGSRQNLEVERSLMQTRLKMQGPDGLLYYPIEGRPWALPSRPDPAAGLDRLPTGKHWCSIAMNGRILGAFCLYALQDPNGPWATAANRLVKGLRRVITKEKDIAYLSTYFAEPGKVLTKRATKPTGWFACFAGWVAQGLAQAHTIGNEEAVDLAERLILYTLRDSGYFGPAGQFGLDSPMPIVHFHAHTNQIMAALDVVRVTGNQRLLNLALQAYDYAVQHENAECGNAKIGYFAEKLTNDWEYPCEMCEVADMIASAVKLCQLGIDKWDDVDRWVRNHFAEGQLTQINWITDGHLTTVDRKKYPVRDFTGRPVRHFTTDRVAERNLGAFAGWATANDWTIGSNQKPWKRSIQHCCTGNATRAIYYVWKNVLSDDGRALRINLLLNRASPWADIDSQIPFQGRVEIRMKQDRELEVRIPEWVKPGEAKCTIGGSARKLTYRGRYAKVGRVKPGDIVVVEFPIFENTEVITIEKHEYTIVRRGNEVVHIEPPGVNCPLYQRAHYRGGETLWKKTTRFVPDVEIDW